MVIAGQSILQQLGIDGCNEGEFEFLLANKLGGGGGDRHNPRALLFPNDDVGYAVKLLYDSEHRLRDALAGSTLDDATIAEIRHQVDTDLRETGESKVGNRVLFAPVPMTGAFRYQDQFQLLPVPDEAPRAHDPSTEHPFLLQFRYAGSPNGLVDGRRQTIRGDELELLLVGLLSSQIHDDSDESAQWVRPPTLNDSAELASSREFSSILCQRCYTYPGMKGFLAEFTPIADYEPLNLIPPAEFQNRLGRHIGQVFDLPANFAQMLSDYNCLDAGQSLKFRTACHWLQQSARTRRRSKSLSYVALALAVEALMPPQESGKRCECCGKSTEKGPTLRFKEFLEPFTSASSVVEVKLQRLYGIRSKLAHGGALLVSDRERLIAPLLASFEDWQNEDHLHFLVRAAFIHWLAEHGQQARDRGATPPSDGAR